LEVICLLTEQDLSESVIALQRRNLTEETREVVEEAARLLSEGREGEARALLEKADALASQEDTGPRTNTKNSGAVPAPEAIIAPLAARLAEGFTGLLTSVVKDLHQYTASQIQAASEALENHIEELDAALEDVVSVAERLDQRANDQQTSLREIHDAQGQMHGAQGEMWEAIQSLQLATHEQRESITRLTTARDELTRQVSNQAEAAASRIATLEERMSLLDRLVEEMPGQFSDILARLDHHTEALHALENRHARRVSTLNQVLDSLGRLKEPESADRALPAFA
jgi:methyl-accepting chemotaxis protein